MLKIQEIAETFRMGSLGWACSQWWGKITTWERLYSTIYIHIHLQHNYIHQPYSHLSFLNLYWMQQPLRERSDLLSAGQLRRLGFFSLIMHVHFSFPFLFLRIGTTEGPTQICSQRQNPLIRQRKEGVASCPDSHYSTLFLITQHYSIHRQPGSGKPKHFFHRIYPDTVVRHNSCWHDEFLDAAVTQERLGGCYNTSPNWSSMVSALIWKLRFNMAAGDGRQYGCVFHPASVLH